MRVHVMVTGRVQGVFYRAGCAAEARARAVTGWVRNLPDGRVEAVFEGPEREVQEMVDWCRKGPSSARVEKVESWHEEVAGDREFLVVG